VQRKICLEVAFVLIKKRVLHLIKQGKDAAPKTFYINLL